MSKQIEDGGPAFPLPRKYTEPGNDIAYHEDFGMTLRDYFAAKAMQSELINADDIDGKRFALLMKMADSEGESVADTMAREAYAMADAMLRARKAGAK